MQESEKKQIISELTRLKEELKALKELVNEAEGI